MIRCDTLNLTFFFICSSSRLKAKASFLLVAYFPSLKGLGNYQLNINMQCSNDLTNNKQLHVEVARPA